MPEKTVQKESGKKPVPSKKPKPQQEVVVQIPLSELHPFPDHPFQVREDASMQETAESVKEYGVLVPALARPREDGGYELIAGHRRKHACELAGLATMPVIVRNIDRDAATIIMVDSNLQRENILPSERAKAYKMKMEAIKRQGARTDLTSPKISAKFRSDDEVGQDMGIELSPPAFTTPLGYTYHIGDCISSIELDHIAAVGVIARVDEDHVWHTLPNVPGQEPVSIDRNSFERYLDTRYFEVSEPEPQRVIAAQHTEQPTPETPQAVQNLMGQRVEIDGKLYNVDSADETVAHLSVVSSSSESNHDPEHRTEPVSAVLTRIADQGRELAPNISAYQALRAEHPEKLIGVRVGERLLFYGADAERAASALNRRLLQRDIPGMGETAVTGYDFGQWASGAKRLLEHGHSFVFAQPNETDGYDVINEADAKEYIPIGMELEIDGRKYVIDSVNFGADEVSLRDVTFQNRQGFPIFRAEHIAFVRSFVEEQEQEQPQPIAKPVAFYLDFLQKQP